MSLAAVSASLGLSLAIKVLEITRRRRDFQGDPEKIDQLLAAARIESEQLAQYADEDIVAYADYMASRGTPTEAAALRRAVEIPLDAARRAAAGWKLCQEAATLASSSIAPDVWTAALLLAASARAMLLTVESNVARVADAQFRDEVERELHNLRERTNWPQTTSAGEQRPGSNRSGC